MEPASSSPWLRPSRCSLPSVSSFREWMKPLIWPRATLTSASNIINVSSRLSGRYPPVLLLPPPSSSEQGHQVVTCTRTSDGTQVSLSCSSFKPPFKPNHSHAPVPPSSLTPPPPRSCPPPRHFPPPPPSNECRSGRRPWAPRVSISWCSQVSRGKRGASRTCCLSRRVSPAR